jgi:hypothetical protein
LFVMTCTLQSGTASLSTHTGRFFDRLEGPWAAIACFSGSWMQSVIPSVTVLPSRIGQATGCEPHVLRSPWFQVCRSGTVSAPLDTSRSASLVMFATSGWTRAAIAAPRAGSLSSTQMPAAAPACIAARLTTLASATTPAGGMPCCCSDHAT